MKIISLLMELTLVISTYISTFCLASSGVEKLLALEGVCLEELKGSNSLK